MKQSIQISTVSLSIVLLSLFSAFQANAEDYAQSKTLLETSQTVIGETIHYPGGGLAEIMTMVVVLPPGESTVWHKHGVPLYAYLLSGILEVDYGDMGKRTYHAGDNFMETMGVFHQGHNSGQEPVSILAVFMGGEGQPLVIQKEP